MKDAQRKATTKRRRPRKAPGCPALLSDEEKRQAADAKKKATAAPKAPKEGSGLPAVLSDEEKRQAADAKKKSTAERRKEKKKKAAEEAAPAAPAALLKRSNVSLLSSDRKRVGPQGPTLFYVSPRISTFPFRNRFTSPMGTSPR